MKPSARVREEAALIASVMASTPDVYAQYQFVSESLGLDRSNERELAGGGYGKDTVAEWLAIQAWSYAYRRLQADNQTLDAEAESLLRSGWSPGDEAK